MKVGDVKTGGIPFDNFFPHSNGFVARQVFINDPSALVITWRYSHNGTHEITLALASTDLSNTDEARHFLSGYDHGDEFLRICKHRRVTAGILIDVSLLLSILSSILRRFAYLRELEKESVESFYKLHVWGLWGRIPFLDMADYIQFVREHGIPIIQDDIALSVWR